MEDQIGRRDWKRDRRHGNDDHSDHLLSLNAELLRAGAGNPPNAAHVIYDPISGSLSQQRHQQHPLGASKIKSTKKQQKNQQATKQILPQLTNDVTPRHRSFSKHQRRCVSETHSINIVCLDLQDQTPPTSQTRPQAVTISTSSRSIVTNRLL